MGWAQWVILVVSLVIQYGPKLVSLLIDIYNAVERWSLEQGAADGKIPSSADKRGLFAKLVTALFAKRKGVIPSGDKLASINADIWRRVNGRQAVPVDKPVRPLDLHGRQMCAARLRMLEVVLQTRRGGNATA